MKKILIGITKGICYILSLFWVLVGVCYISDFGAKAYFISSNFPLTLLFLSLPVGFLVYRFHVESGERYERKIKRMALKEEYNKIKGPSKLRQAFDLNRLVKVKTIIIAVIVCAGLMGVVKWYPQHKDTKYALEVVTNSLKAPTTAEFSNVKYLEPINNIFEVQGYVDSQNGFGAKVRSKFSVIILKDKGKYSVIQTKIE